MSKGAEGFARFLERGKFGGKRERVLNKRVDNRRNRWTGLARRKTFTTEKGNRKSCSKRLGLREIQFYRGPW